jgi:hypothetical protein
MTNVLTSAPVELMLMEILVKNVIKTVQYVLPFKLVKYVNMDSFCTMEFATQNVVLELLRSMVNVFHVEMVVTLVTNSILKNA